MSDWTPGDPVHRDQQHPTAARLGLPDDGSDPVLAAYGVGFREGYEAGRRQRTLTRYLARWHRRLETAAKGRLVAPSIDDRGDQ